LALIWPFNLFFHSIMFFAWFMPTVDVIEAGGAKYVWVVVWLLFCLGVLAWYEHWNRMTFPAFCFMLLATLMWLYAIGGLIYSIFRPIEPVELAS